MCPSDRVESLMKKKTAKVDGFCSLLLNKNSRLYGDYHIPAYGKCQCLFKTELAMTLE